MYELWDTKRSKFWRICIVLLKISDRSSSTTGYVNIIDSLGTCIWTFWTFQTFNQLADNVHPDMTIDFHSTKRKLMMTLERVIVSIPQKIKL